jgi:hypothetical protein
MSAALSTLNVKKSVDDFWPVRNKKVLIRVDYNVPIKHGVISNDYRIRSTLPTLEKVLSQGGSAYPYESSRTSKGSLVQRCLGR